MAARLLCMQKVRGSTPRISSNLRMVTCSTHVGCFLCTYSSVVERSIAGLLCFSKKTQTRALCHCCFFGSDFFCSLNGFLTFALNVRYTCIPEHRFYTCYALRAVKCLCRRYVQEELKPHHFGKRKVERNELTLSRERTSVVSSVQNPESIQIKNQETNYHQRTSQHPPHPLTPIATVLVYTAPYPPTSSSRHHSLEPSGDTQRRYTARSHCISSQLNSILNNEETPVPISATAAITTQFQRHTSHLQRPLWRRWRTPPSNSQLRPPPL